MSLRIDECFKKKSGRSVFIGYLTAGYPNLELTEKFIYSLDEAGVDVLELGVPFSDPVADGPIIQRSSQAALEQGTGLNEIFELIYRVRTKGIDLPIIIFSYLNPIFRFGFDEFAKSCREAGADGALIVDLPPELADGYLQHMKKQGLKTIFLVAPTTPEKRLAQITLASSGFIYYVARKGVTGLNQGDRSEAETAIRHLRKQVNIPICVGFGISTPEQVSHYAAFSEGVVVGSAFVEFIHRRMGETDLVANLGKFANKLVQATQ